METRTTESLRIPILAPADRCIQTSLPIAAALSLPIYVEFGLSEWYSPVAPGTGLHPRPARTDDLLQYFPRPTTKTSTGTIIPETTATTNAYGSYIDPRWKTTYLVTRKGESVAELYARCEAFLRAFLGRVEGQPHFVPSSAANAVPVPNVLVHPSF